jgi:hypothetical protein
VTAQGLLGAGVAFAARASVPAGRWPEGVWGPAESHDACPFASTVRDSDVAHGSVRRRRQALARAVADEKETPIPGGAVGVCCARAPGIASRFGAGIRVVSCARVRASIDPHQGAGFIENNGVAAEAPRESAVLGANTATRDVTGCAKPAGRNARGRLDRSALAIGRHRRPIGTLTGAGAGAPRSGRKHRCRSPRDDRRPSPLRMAVAASSHANTRFPRKFASAAVGERADAGRMTTRRRWGSRSSEEGAAGLGDGTALGAQNVLDVLGADVTPPVSTWRHQLRARRGVCVAARRRAARPACRARTVAATAPRL